MPTKTKYFVFLIVILFFISSCNIQNLDKNSNVDENSGIQLSNPNICYETIKNWVKDNPLLNLEKETKKYCGYEKVGNVEIWPDVSLGYKSAIIMEYQGHKFPMGYHPDIRDAAEWLKTNSPKNAKILTWWDSGTMVKVFAEREAVSMIPSKQELDLSGPPIGGNSSSWIIYNVKLQDDETNKKIAMVYTTNNSAEAVKIIKEFGAKYILFSGDLKGKFGIIYWLNYGDFKPLFDNECQECDNANADKDSITYKALNNEKIDGFKKVYDDGSALIYEVI